jgi:hypothetical protein
VTLSSRRSTRREDARGRTSEGGVPARTASEVNPSGGKVGLSFRLTDAEIFRRWRADETDTLPSRCLRATQRRSGTVLPPNVSRHHPSQACVRDVISLHGRMKPTLSFGGAISTYGYYDHGAMTGWWLR